MHTSEPRVRLPELTSEQCTVLAATARDALDKLPVNRRAAADAEVDAEQWKVIEPVLRPLDNKHTALTNLVFTFARTLAFYANRRSTPDTQSVVTAIRIACGISPQEPVWEEVTGQVFVFRSMACRCRRRCCGGPVVSWH